MSDDADDGDFEGTTTAAAVETYESSRPIFDGLLREIRELCRKKPEAIMSSGKVKMINRVLEDLITFLAAEPAGKYLALLDDDTLPQVSDALLMMVQFDSGLDSFRTRHHRYIDGKWYWLTKEQIAEWEKEEEEER